MKPTLQWSGYPMRRPVSLLVTLPLILLLAGCQTGQSRPTGDPCAGWHAIVPAKTDIMAPRTADQLLSHNCHGVQMKCWVAPNKSADDACKALNAPKKK
jgi:hypothetical protein